MKKHLAFLLAAIMTAMLCTAGVSATRDLVYTAPHATPAIDGKIDPCWDDAEWTNVDLPYSADTDPYDHAARVKLLWDEDNLYLLGEITCPDVEADNDYLEIYIDELNDKTDAYGADDTQMGFSYQGIVDSYGTNSRWYDVEESVGVITDTGYMVEAAIPFAAAEAKAGTELGLEFMLNITLGGTFVQALRWNVDTASGDAAPYQSTAPFGKLVLGEAAAAETPAPEVDAPVETAPAEAETAPVTAPAETESSAPQTSDVSSIMGIALAIAAACAAVMISRKKIAH